MKMKLQDIRNIRDAISYWRTCLDDAPADQPKWEVAEQLADIYLFNPLDTWWSQDPLFEAILSTAETLETESEEEDARYVEHDWNKILQLMPELEAKYPRKYTKKTLDELYTIEDAINYWRTCLNSATADNPKWEIAGWLVGIGSNYPLNTWREDSLFEELYTIANILKTQKENTADTEQQWDKVQQLMTKLEQKYSHVR